MFKGKNYRQILIENDKEYYIWRLGKYILEEAEGERFFWRGRMDQGISEVEESLVVTGSTDVTDDVLILHPYSTAKTLSSKSLKRQHPEFLDVSSLPKWVKTHFVLLLSHESEPRLLECKDLYME